MRGELLREVWGIVVLARCKEEVSDCAILLPHHLSPEKPPSVCQRGKLDLRTPDASEVFVATLDRAYSSLIF